MNHPAAVAAIILNFNGLADTRRALHSLADQGTPILPIVLDNGSAIDEAAPLRTEFPGAHIERLAQNVGFSRGVNHAARIALRRGASYLLLLNSDAWLEDCSAIDRLVAELCSNDRLAATGPVVLNGDATAGIQAAGYRYSLWWPVSRPIRRNGKPGFISGSCMLIDAKRFAELGGFDPDFFLYGEDVDFALRARRHGYAISVVREAMVRHDRCASSQLYSNRYVYTALRGNLVLIKKHAQWYLLPSATIAALAMTFGLALFALKAGNLRAPAMVGKAWVDFLHGRWGGLDGTQLGPVQRPSLADCSPLRHEFDCRTI